MKLIVTGASGFVAREVIRQSLHHPAITSVIAVARTPVSLPKDLDKGADTSKLKSVVVRDYLTYPDEVKREFAGASACVWTVGITPLRSRGYTPEEVKRVSQTSTLAGLEAMYAAGPARPFRFLYMSGYIVERDETKVRGWMRDFILVRAETEKQVLGFAEAHGDHVEACVAKPGMLLDKGLVKRAYATVLKWALSVPIAQLSDVAAAMLDQVVNGFEKEPLMAEDLVRIAQRTAKSQSRAER